MHYSLLCAAALGLLALSANLAPAEGLSPEAAGELRSDPFVKEPGKDPVQKAAPAPPGEGHSLLVFETFALDASRALEILEPAEGAAARYKQMATLVRQGQARLIDLVASATKPGTRNTVESMDDFRYATEFEVNGQAAEPVSGTAFESRSVGESLGHEFVFEPGDPSPVLSYTLKRIVFTGMRHYSEPPGDPAVDQPGFAGQQADGALRLSPGAPQLVLTHSPAPGTSPAYPDAEIHFTFARFVPQLLAPHTSAPALGRAALVEYTFISLDRSSAEEVLSGSLGLDEAWHEATRLVADHQGRLEHAMAVSAEQNRRAQNSEGSELRYPTEFEPHSLTDPVIDWTETSRTEDRPSSGGAIASPPDANRVAIREATTRHAATGKPVPNPGYPTAFETRDLGYKVEQELKLNPARTAGDLSAAITFVANRGIIQHDGAVNRQIEQPLFEQRVLKTVALAAPGRHILLGTLNPPGANGVNGRKDSGAVWLCFACLSSAQP